MLDDATYDDNAAASAGTVSFAAPTLSWAGDVPADGTVTITYSVTVNNPDTGNMILASTISSPSSGSNCPAGAPGPRCTATVTVSQLADRLHRQHRHRPRPGGVVTYTATLANTGQTPYLGISVGTDATGISDDATGNGDQAASSGTLSIGATGAVWTGDIPVGGHGHHHLHRHRQQPRHREPHPDRHRGIRRAGKQLPGRQHRPPLHPRHHRADPGPVDRAGRHHTTSAVPGQVIGYTLTITNTGQTTYTGAAVTESFAQMLDDAAYNGDAAAVGTGAGTVSYAAPILTWTGDLAAGASAVITFSVTVNNPDTGDKLVITTAASTAVGSTCPPGTTSSPCQLTVPVLTPALTITTTATPATATPGGTVTYTLTITDTGQTPYTGASRHRPAGRRAGRRRLQRRRGRRDTGTGTATVTYASPVLSWTGDLTPGDTATITYSVTVNNPDTGNHILASTVTSATAGQQLPGRRAPTRAARPRWPWRMLVIVFSST